MELKNHAGSFNRLVRYAPLWFHLTVYIFTCLMAAIFMYFGYKPILVFIEYFSGVTVPTNYSSQVAMVLWLLLLGAPSLFALGFFAATRSPVESLSRFSRSIVGERELGPPVWIPALIFGASVGMGVYDINRVGMFSRLNLWLDYGGLLEGRYALFSYMGFFDWVNLYTILPISAAWVILSVPSGGKLNFFLRLVPWAIVVILTAFLFQKKALIVSLVIIMAAVFLHRLFTATWTRRATWALVVGGGLLTTTYFLSVVLPIYSETSRTASQALIKQAEVQSPQAEAQSPQAEAQSPQVEAQSPQVESQRMLTLAQDINCYIGTHRQAHILAYALLSPMTRTSLAAIYYPVVFPESHAFYGLDLGQDILGFGGMPDDNVVVWNQMNPNLPGGNVAAPFQFVLYSQVGLGWALFLSGLVGALLGLGWELLLTVDTCPVYKSLMGSIFLLFSVHIALDSIRGSILSSYGIVWAWFFIIFFFLIAQLFKRKQWFQPV